ncbi:uncharacterized protein LOC106667553 isoform X1 [Cimex lectularius]|uniref:MYND-type domain-containing protein n=1 Tax=Cimex lectularius TaxID=79782 RepID=A0A8I6RRD5_CIMLE|nr:uncharacterized protein LOC106667553 isoform X1 [Cimex lectularius]
MEMEMPQEEMAFTEWSEKLEAGTSHWLPAYGFQQPTQLHEALLQHEYFNNDGIGQSNYVYLETIVEETSDDLRSESDYSEAGGGWPDTDSDADSVIHVPNALGKQNLNSVEWSGSERDLAVPKKRRRRLFNNDPGVQDDEEDERDDLILPPFTCRSSSLLQFEALEKQCDTVFRASASSEQFVHSPSLTSSFSFDSLETSRWRFSGSPDSLDEASSLSSSCSSSSEITSSDDDNLTRSYSSRSGNESYKSSLRSHRSYDSLIMCQEKQDNNFLSGEFSQSLNNNSILVEEDVEAVTPQRGLYKTVECLTEPTLNDNVMEKPEPPKEKKTARGQRSAENLSEDSGFGEHILRRASSSGVFTIAEIDDDDDSSSYSSDRVSEVKIHGDEAQDGGGWSDVGPNFSGWQSAPDLSEGTQSQCDHRDNKNELNLKNCVLADTRPITSTTSLLTFAIRDEDEFLVIPENKDLAKMNSKHPVVSTPNLYTEEFVILDDNEVELTFPGHKATALSRAQSFKEGFRQENKRNLRKTKSKGSNIQITTSFVNLTATPQSGSRRSVNCLYSTSFVNLTGAHNGSSKGVHFSPVVSEVQWKESEPCEWADEVDLDARKERPQEVKENSQPLRPVRGGDRGLPPLPPSPPSRAQQQQNPVVSRASMENRPPKNKSGIGGFFQRFSFRRLSGREKKRKDLKKETAARLQPPPPPSPASPAEDRREDVRIIPLHPPPEEEETTKPPLPPLPSPRNERKREEPVRIGGGSVMSSGPKTGLLETDLDSDTGCNKKARSLLNLGDGRTHLVPCPQPDQPVDHRAKSMEFLLDKENQFAIKPPENELQKVGERVMSEHELRVQRSLQKLNIPDWYKNSQVPSQGFLLKRHSEGGGGAGWQGLSSKTTSLSSLGSMQAATPRSPTGNLLSPSPTPSTHTFSRWSTNRLNSNPTSASTSPCGSARSSFNYRQPYLGWRSQERLTNPRTPAERLAAGILSQQKQNVPNLSEVHTSIKEVTSAINNYIHGNRVDDRLSPAMHRTDNVSSRSASPRGSTGRLCWLESSFVGNKPIDVPETPVSLTATPDHTSGGSDLFLDLSTHRHKMTAVNGMEYQIPGVSISSVAEAKLRNKPSPGSTTMEDVLDSLLGLAPASRSPSPSVAHRSCSDLTNHLAGSASSEPDQILFTADVRRHSEGCDPVGQPLSHCSRRVSFDMAITEGEIVRCRYNKCGKATPLAEAKRTYKTCHNCTHVYCSRECRRAHWEKHRKTCLHSRVGALCRKVMSNIKEDDETLQHISVIARRGYLAKGRGAVKVMFSKPRKAEDFIGEGYNRLGEPTYIKWPDLQPDETGKEMHDELIRLCKSYNPDTRFVLYVAVCVVSEVPSSSAAVKWEMQLVSRCAKLKLCASLGQMNVADISKDGKEPDTLILTSLPGARDQGSRKARQISFTNIQRHLRQRGISLRRQFPEVYQRLCAYVEGATERFVPVTIYPRDAISGKNFMCIIMPDADPEKLELIPTDSAHVQTIDISTDPDSSVNTND